MRLIKDNQVPGEGFERSHDLWPLYEIDRSDDNRPDGPRVHPRRQVRRGVCDASSIEHVHFEAETASQLIAPLVAEGRRRNHQCPRIRSAFENLGDHQTGLDGLAQAHRVGDEEAAAAPRQGHRGLELKGEERQVRPCGGPQRGPGWGGFRQHASGEMTPAARADDTRRRGLIETIGGFEWEEKP